MLAEQLVQRAGNLENFIEQFSVFALTPNGVNKLRYLILQLAAMGRLVENNKDSSETLLENLIAKKEALIRLKVIKRLKPTGTIAESEKRFLIPKSWVWARASDIFDIRDGTHDSPKYHDTGYPLVTSKNIYSGKLDLTNVKYISEEDHRRISERSSVDMGDILFAMIGSIGNPVVVEIEPAFSVKNVGLFKYYDRSKSVPGFLLLYLKLAGIWMKEEASGAVQSFVSLGKLRSIPFPLPTVEEQKRIVAKVDELMALCDQLEAQQQQQANTVLRANTAAIAALLNSESHSTNPLAKEQNKAAIATATAAKANKIKNPTFEQNWQRIAQHFNTLYGCALTMPPGEGRQKKHLVGLENARYLRKAILQLAVLGKLSYQNMDDEPPKNLLGRIAFERNQLAKDNLDSNLKCIT